MMIDKDESRLEGSNGGIVLTRSSVDVCVVEICEMTVTSTEEMTEGWGD